MSTGSDKIRVGYQRHSYPELRNIIGRVSDAEYIRMPDWFSALERASRIRGMYRLIGSAIKDSQFRFRPFRNCGVDVIHLFNSVAWTRTPWISTFETVIPRYIFTLQHFKFDPGLVQRHAPTVRALELLSNQSCRKLLALSSCSLAMQDRLLSLFPEFQGAIREKTHVLHPPQAAAPLAVVSRRSDRRGREELRFVIVGHHFFRKGGREVIDALSDGRRRYGWPVKLEIVSQLVPGDYASGTTEQDADSVRRFIAANSDWIRWQPSLPNERVLDLIAECDVGLLPSYAETYGYSVLEFQSMGLPVVTTDVRAFPEINDDEAGWLIQVPKSSGGEATYRTITDRQAVSEAIRRGIQRIVPDLLHNPSLAVQKGLAAHRRIATHHDPQTHAGQLRQIYREAMQS